MPPMLAVTLAGTGLYLIARAIRREMARVARILDGPAAKPEANEIRLERDPATGVYRLDRQ